MEPLEALDRHRTAEAADDRRRLLQRHGLCLRRVDDNTGNLHVLRMEHADRGERMAQCAEVASGHEDRWRLKGRHVGGQRFIEAPGRDRGDSGGIRGQSQGLQEDAAVAVGQRVGIQARGHRFQRVEQRTAGPGRHAPNKRERRRRFDAEAAVPHATRSGATVHLHKVHDPDGGEVRLYCYSEDRAKKERGIAERFEQDLKALHEGLSRPGTQKRIDLIWQRIGRMREKSHGAGQHYEVKVDLDETGQRAVAVHFTRQPVDGTLATHPGVYCLRSNETDWDEPALWRTYTMLTDLEAVFRSLKSELGLRPIYHRKPRRAEGHLFITVIAYQLVQVIRKTLAKRADGELKSASWTTLRRILGARQRVTATFKRADGRTLHVRKATVAEPNQQAILDALGIPKAADGGTCKMIV